jgi:hypothetical protein
MKTDRRRRTRYFVVLLFALAGGVGGTITWAQINYHRIADQGIKPELPADRHGTPTWEVDPHFKSDVFTFCRIRYTSIYRGSTWITDFPDSDLNFSFRLQQMTSLKVNPHPVILDLTDPRLFDYPFIYMLEVANLEFTEEEIVALRRYLLNGGFLMVDDFWGVRAWNSFEQQLKRVFPDKDTEDLEIDHPIFHCVFDLKEKPQMPGIEWAISHKGMDNQDYERYDAKGSHYRALYDDKGRIMVLVCQNVDLGDGWEREGEDEWYFHHYSERLAYPMGINIIFWAMTH